MTTMASSKWREIVEEMGELEERLHVLRGMWDQIQASCAHPQLPYPWN